MQVLIVYSTAYGNTEAIAQAMAAALSTEADVEVRRASGAADTLGSKVDLLLVGAPTQQRGAPVRIGVRGFVESLARPQFAGTWAAAFDTRLDAPEHRTGSAGAWIETALRDAGCRIVVPRAGFLVEGYRGPLVAGENERAAAWAGLALAAARTGSPVPPAPLAYGD